MIPSSLLAQSSSPLPIDQVNETIEHLSRALKQLRNLPDSPGEMDESGVDMTSMNEFCVKFAQPNQVDSEFLALPH